VDPAQVVSRVSDPVPVRVLIDQFHDASRHEAAETLRPAGMTTTVCRRRLTASLLARYHVVIISGYAPKRFTPAELRAIEQFVADGGGLLLTSSAPRFELDVARPLDELPAQAVADLFGYRFLSAAEARGRPRRDRRFRLGFAREDVRVADGAPEGFGPHPPQVQAWLPVEPPDDATPLLIHRRTHQPLAAMSRHGKGRVCVAGEPFGRVSAFFHLVPLVKWLAGETKPRPGRSIPVVIGPEPKMKRHAGMRVIYDANAEGHLDELLPVVTRVREEVGRIVGDEAELPELVRVVDGCVQAGGWWNTDTIGVRGAPWSIAWDATWWLLMARLGHGQLGDALVSVFPEYTVIRFLAIEILRRLGFEDQARRLHETALAMYDPEDPEQSGCDLARMYWATIKWHPKGYWAMEQLRQKHGFGLFERLCEIVPARGASEGLPAHTWSSDHAIYYLSLAAGEDLFGWFAEIGTTVHPIPIIKRDAKGFKRAAMDAVLAAARRGNASERMEAIAHLAGLDDKEREELPRRVRELADGMRMADRDDARADEALARVMRSKPDSQDATLAALQLAGLGDPEACRRLPGLAAGEDTRFRLWSGYALAKAGRDETGLSLRAIGEVDVQPFTDLEIHAKVEGYEVANVVCEPGWAQFPHGNWATRFFVYWVHTSSQWRRMGLSRQLFEIAMNHPIAQACSTFALSTGTRNVAHRMYADFGFVDMAQCNKHTRQLSGGPRCLPPDGVTVRAMKEGEAAKVREFVAEVISAGFADWQRELPELGPRDRVVMAFEGEKLVGVAAGSAGVSGEGQLKAVCVPRDHKLRGDLGAAMLTALHDRLAEDGAKKIELRTDPEDAFWGDVLARTGYGMTQTGGVEMFGIRDLGQLFGEILPLFGKRMREGKCPDWQGRVMIVGERLKAGLEIDAGEVAVVSDKPRRGDVVVTAPDRVITRFVTGRETPMDGYLQTFAAVDPRPSPGVMQVLETLFPVVPWINYRTLG